MNQIIDYTPIELVTPDPWYEKVEFVEQIEFSTGSNSWFHTYVDSPSFEQREKGLKYKVVFQTDEEGGFVATIPNLPGCVTEGDSLEEAYRFLCDALEGWVKVAQEKNLSIPSPEKPKT